MRLKSKEIEHIKSAAQASFGEDIKVYLFGSRVDDSKKGGDIDIYIEVPNSKLFDQEELLRRKFKMLNLLERALGEQKIDIVVNNFTNQKFIYSVAINEGILL